MNFKKTTFLLALSLFLVWSCQVKKNTKSHYQRQWMLVSFQDYSKDFLMKNKAELNLSQSDPENPQFSAYMGCNQMMVSGEVKGNSKIKLEVTGVTMQFCEGNMDLERKFIASLPTMSRYKIEGHFLTLSDEKGNTMKFVAADWD